LVVYANLNKKRCNYKAIFEPESTKEVEQVLMKLAWDYFLGGTIALVFSTIGGTC